jgi:hypothetical protein
MVNKREIQKLSGFESILREVVVDKSTLLSKIMDIEIFYFSKKNDDIHQLD